MKIIILVGLPGSGKSTWCYRNFMKFVRINQDEQGSREECLRMARFWLEEGKKNRPDLVICIDRTNINEQQRKIWIDLAKEYDIQNVQCIYFQSTPERCLERIKERKEHPTIPENLSTEKLKSIINKFQKDLKEPELREGFDSINIYNIDNWIEFQSSQNN